MKKHSDVFGDVDPDFFADIENYKEATSGPFLTAPMREENIKFVTTQIINNPPDIPVKHSTDMLEYFSKESYDKMMNEIKENENKK